MPAKERDNMEYIRRTVLQGAGTLAASVVTANAALAQEGSDMKLSHGSNSAEEPAPIITGASQAEGIAKFAIRASYQDLTPERRERLKVSVLDSLACAINALGVPPIVACLEQARQFGGSDARCTLIGGGKANVVYAAQYNTAVVRYVDYMDSYLRGEELCHPSDNVGSILAVCEHAGRSGKEFLTALAVAYQVESALTANASYWVSPSLPLRDVVRLPGGHHSTPRSLDLITRARFRRWTNASVTTRPAASTSVVCAGLKDSPAPIAERRGSHG